MKERAQPEEEFPDISVMEVRFIIAVSNVLISVLTFVVVTVRVVVTAGLLAAVPYRP